MELLRAENVSYQYKNKHQVVEAIKDFSYPFEKAKIYAIVGSSGSGKSTLLSLFAGLDHPSRGEVLFKGKSLRGENREKYRRESITMIYQDFNLFPMLTSLENVQFPLWINRISEDEARKKALDALRCVGLGQEFDQRYPRQLSGGQQQRVAIARSLVADSEMILADEPTGNLDTENSIQIFELLFELSKKYEKTIIIATHNMDLAKRADTIIELRDGRLCF